MKTSVEYLQILCRIKRLLLNEEINYELVNILHAEIINLFLAQYYLSTNKRLMRDPNE